MSQQKYEIDNHLLQLFLSGRMGKTFSTYDLGWWLECKTNQEFTVVQTQILRDLFKLFDLQKSQIQTFEDILIKNLDCIKRKSSLEKFLDESSELEEYIDDKYLRNP